MFSFVGPLRCSQRLTAVLLSVTTPTAAATPVHYYDKDFSLSEQNIKVSLSHPQLQGGQIGFDLGVKLV